MLLFNFKLKYNGEWVYYFNTSNVTIQLQKVFNSHFVFYYFNTSNVTIQPLMSNIQGMTLIFQYI